MANKVLMAALGAKSINSLQAALTVKTSDLNNPN